MRIRTLVAAIALVLAAVPALPASAQDQEPEWAPVEEATIKPGVQIRTDSGGCTTNFVFYERHETTEGAVSFDVFIGLAAHCFTLGGSTGTNGCTTESRELGSQADVSGADHPATLVYSSWVTMKEVDEEDSATCGANDFAIVQLDGRDHDKVNPTLQYYGGPTALRNSETSTGDEVYSYGNSSLRFGISELSPKRGVSTGTTSSGWTHHVYTVTPGIPGDSGSAFVDEEGQALGVVVTLQLLPLAGSNGVTDMAKALAYLNANTDMDVQLGLGTEPFVDPVLP